jgi:hypothetical protein
MLWRGKVKDYCSASSKYLNSHTRRHAPRGGDGTGGVVTGARELIRRASRSGACVYPWSRPQPSFVVLAIWLVRNHHEQALSFAVLLFRILLGGAHA